ncbi:MAG: 23S rRNA (uracil(747)-C(5))-methyltransferase RlmC [Lonepinella koalarum]|nr:23S rRNA (uracil(747)-C(5))-methyltransferase RlmC [Lonepinella koalarum]
MICLHFEQKNCTSCQWLPRSYDIQLADKSHHLQGLLSALDLSQTQWFPPFPSAQQGFRNKAKMVVSGAVERPILGIINEQNQPVDLTDCPHYPSHFSAIFPILKDFIGRAGLVPYNVAKQKGELKFILLTESRFNQELMLRFVLRSEDKIPLIKRELAGLQAKLPQLKVITANIQPQHAAILEGEKEIFLTEQQVVEERFNHIPLFIRPQSFFQTNPQVAEGLYSTAQQWISDLPVQKLWDLFCGVGGFGLHCATALAEKNHDVELIGIEISPSAIYSATLSAKKCGLKNVRFQSFDAKNFAFTQENLPDLVIVNPPRRGIGLELAQFLNKLQPQFILYSSCNAVTMATDLQQLTHYQILRIRLFDMFPHTSHYEVLTLLAKRSK